MNSDEETMQLFAREMVKKDAMTEELKLAILRERDLSRTEWVDKENALNRVRLLEARVEEALLEAKGALLGDSDILAVIEILEAAPRGGGKL